MWCWCKYFYHSCKYLLIRGVVNEADIDQMLQTRNISKEDFNTALKELSFEEKGTIKDEMRNICWLQKYNEIIFLYSEKGKVDCKNIQNYDLSLSVSPFLLWVNLELRKSIENLKHIQVKQETIVKMLDKLTNCLLSHSIKTLVWELHLYQKNRYQECDD